MVLQQLFDRIASDYDHTNTIISCGLIHLWYRKLVQAMVRYATNINTPTVLDVCCGTGAVGQRFLRSMSSQGHAHPHLVCADFSVQMLAIAQRNLPPTTTFYATQASSLPCSDASFDVISMAFGYRNITNKQAVLMEMSRLLKHDGRLFILELVTPQYSIFAWIHSLYLKHVLIPLGTYLTGSAYPYEYFGASVQKCHLSACVTEITRSGLVLKSVRKFFFGSCVLFEVAHQ